MNCFIDALMELQGSSNYRLRNFFLQDLKLELNFISRDFINTKRQNYQVVRKKLSEIPPEIAELNEKVELKKELEDIQKNIVESSFGLEHLFREIGQIYEAGSKDQQHTDYCAQLCKIVAELLIDGYPLELMDGDASHVPVVWIKALFSEVIEQIGDQKIFVLSVLGVQSSGKSTLLNTTFGLQFNVSAGRCTRGVFMQIIPLNNSLKSSTGCSYMLVVDTEGLRAPELDLEKTKHHDNELATFVIGLANMTLVNIYGEVPGDMDDILQTSVHAFLRMTKVRFHPSCQFVHQNAADSIKNEVGRDKFTQKLNKFAVDAAREEHCEGQYKSFSEVIKFDDQTDVHYFPGLFKGDPPRAPINQGYSNRAQKLKQHVIQMINNTACFTNSTKYKLSGLTFSSFSLKVTSLWENLLKEKFIFSFKNTLEIVAYNYLETEYCKWDWILQMAMLAWEREAYNEIRSEDLSSVQKVVDKKLQGLQEYVSNKHKELKSQMEVFFIGKHSEVLVQWKQSSEIRLRRSVDDYTKNAEQYIKMLLQNRKAISDFEKKQKVTLQKIKDTVNENIQTMKQEKIQLEANLEEKELDEMQLSKLLSRDLFTIDRITRYKAFGIPDDIIEKIFAIKQKCGSKLDKESLKEILFEVLTLEQVKKVLKNIFMSEEELKHKFDELWDKEMSSITYYHSKRDIDVPKIVETTLLRFTKAQGGHDTHLISKLNGTECKGWAKGKMRPFKPNEGEHYTYYVDPKLMKKVHRRVQHFCYVDSYHFQLKVEGITNAIIQDAKDFVLQISRNGSDFRSTFVQELLQWADNKVYRCAATETMECKLSFTPDYKQEVYLRICSSAIPKFEKMAKVFEEQNDPVLYLKKFHKEPLFTKYKNQYKQIEFEEAIADTICAYLEAPLKIQVRETLGENVIDKMKSLGIYYIKNKMGLKVKILLELQKKSDFQEYVLYLRNIRECLVQHLTRYTIEFCEKEVKDSQFSHLQAIAREQVSLIIGTVNNTLLSINKQNIGLKEWLLIFCQDSVLAGLGLKIKMEDLLEGYEYSQTVNIENLKTKISQQLHQLEERALKYFEDIHCETEMPHWTKQPHELLKNLIGCTAQCPFCGEQCDLMEHDVKDQLHRTEVHRIDCLAGWREKQSQIMVTGFCPSLVADKQRQFYKTNDELHHYYKYSEVYPTWSIPPNLSVNTTYWKWFVNIYQLNLAVEYNAKPPNVPNPWRNLKWNDVREDLQMIYNIKATDVNY